jgi:hypothetical protein
MFSNNKTIQNKRFKNYNLKFGVKFVKKTYNYKNKSKNWPKYKNRKTSNLFEKKFSMPVSMSQTINSNSKIGQINLKIKQSKTEAN